MSTTVVDETKQGAATAPEGQTETEKTESVDTQYDEGKDFERPTIDAIKKMALVEKIACMQWEMGWLPKRGTNKNLDYNYLQEADIVARVRALSRFYRVLVIVRQLPMTTTYNTELRSAQNKPMTGVQTKLKYDVINLDPDAEGRREKLSDILGDLISEGYAADTSDKALYKARTGAKKYAFNETFLVASGNDPEIPGLADEKTQQGGDGRTYGRGERGDRGGGGNRNRNHRNGDGGGGEQAPRNAIKSQVDMVFTIRKKRDIKWPILLGKLGVALGITMPETGDEKALTEFLYKQTFQDMNKVLHEIQKTEQNP